MSGEGLPGRFESGRVRVGDHVRWRGEEFRVDALAGPTVTLQPVAPGAGAPVDALYRAVAGAADFAVLDPTGRPVERTGLPPLGTLLRGVSKEDRANALKWHRHIKEIDTGIRPGRLHPRSGYDPATTTVAQRCQAKAAELEDLGDVRVSWRTLDDKRRKWKAAGENPLVLIVDGRRARPPRPGGHTDPRLIEAMHEVTNALARESGGRINRALDLVEDLVRRRYAKELRDPAEAERLLLPQSTFYKRMAELGLSDVLRQTTRQRSARASKPKGPHTPSHALKPGQLTQIDTTPLKIKALGEDGEVVSAELTSLVDVASRSVAGLMIVPAVTGDGPVGQRVGGRATRAFDLVLTLAQCFAPLPTQPGWDPLTAAATSALPFGELRAADPRFTEATAARPVIHPATIVLDQGSPYLSQHFEDVCAFLRIAIRYARKDQPTDKPIGERFFSTLADGFSQHVAGWTGRNHQARGRGIDRGPLWTINELQQMAHEWVALEYQQLPHKGLTHPALPGQHLSPNEMYAALVSRSGYRPRPLTPEDSRKLLVPAWVKVNDKGFEVDNRPYQSPSGELEPLQGLDSGLAGPGAGGRWEVRYDPYRPEVAWLYDHRSPGRWIKAEFVHRHLLNDPWTVDHWDAATALVLADGGRKDHRAAIALAVKDRRRRTRTAPPRSSRTTALPPFQGPALDVEEVAEDRYAGLGDIDLDAIVPSPARVLPTTSPVPVQRPAPASTALAGLFGDDTDADDEDDDPEQEQRAALLGGDTSTDTPVTPFQGEL